MKTPEVSKLTTKGNIPKKLATVGIDAADLHNYTVVIEADDVNLLDIAQEAAERVVSAVCAEYPSELWEQGNGTGYIENWKAQIASDIIDVATGTAVQGRAFKQTVCDNVEGCTMDHFKADGQARAKTEKPNLFTQG